MIQSRTVEGEQTETIGPRIQLVRFDQITLGTERRDLVRGLIPREGLAVVWGAPKSGKSFWMFDVAMHVALGWDYRGRRVHQGPVVYCAFEGQSGLRARVEAFRQSRLAEEATDVPFYLQSLTLDLIGEHAELIAAIRAQVAEGAPALVVLDTLNRSLRGSESRDEDMAAYVRAADVIREAFKCSVAVVHHCGVNETRPRGHTSLTGAVDVQIAISRDVAENVIATIELAKDGPQGDVIVSRLDIVDVGKDQDGETIRSCVVVAVDGGPVRRPGRRVKLTPAEEIARRALIHVLDHGPTERAPALDGVPPSTVAVRVGAMRDQAFRTGLADGADADASTGRVRWSRAKDGLISKKFARQDGDLIWLV
jgi:hypothetical protein